ncbi:MAG TPA: threonine/serine dehydratase, partial [Caldilineaceae bacterium]|nr:threonine/serine dehydratase [Caldilineaceae bacterium]
MTTTKEAHFFPTTQRPSVTTPLDIPSLDEIRAARQRIDPYIVRTPVWRWASPESDALVGPETELYLKLELFQKTGTFKPRGAVNNLLALDGAARQRGVTAVSAGNHAIAVAYAAQLFGSSAKVVMPKSAPPFRVAKARSYGAEVVLVDDVHTAFAEVRRIEAKEGRTFIHPFESRPTIVGQATVGLEFCQDAPPLDALIIPIGGGGLAAGIATAVKQMQPDCAIYGVEPTGADSMSRSFAAGGPQAIDRVRTIADSLGAPRAEAYSYALCRHFLDEIVLVSDDELKSSMRLLFHSLKLAAEPACAASTAALLGPLREKLQGKRVGLILCGSNIGLETYVEQTASADHT